MTDTTIREHRNELNELLDAMKSEPERQQLKEGERFARIQHEIAAHHVATCNHTGYPVAARG